MIVEIEKSQPNDFLFSAWHEDGDTVFYGGADGQIWAEDLEEETEEESE